MFWWPDLVLGLQSVTEATIPITKPERLAKEDSLSASQRALFDEQADSWVQARWSNKAPMMFSDFWANSLLELVDGRHRGMKVLDNMCGAGDMLRTLVRHFQQVYAADLNEKLVRAIPAAVRQRVGIQVADTRYLPFKDESFDVVFVRGGLHHIFNDLSGALEEIHRVIRPGGQFICSEPRSDSLLIRTARAALYNWSTKVHAGEEHPFFQQELVATLERHGFAVELALPFGYLAYTLIGFPNILPCLFAPLGNEFVIRLLLRFDRISSKVPLWRNLATAVNLRARRR